MHQSHLQGDLSDAPHREIPFSSDKTKVIYISLEYLVIYHFFKPNFALLAKESRKSTGSSGEEKYIYGDFHAFRNVSNNSTNSLDEVTPVRRAIKVH